MYFLDCNANLKPVMTLVGLVIRVIQIGIPILLIVLGSIDLGKAVIANKDDEVKKAQKTFVRRLLYAVAVFLVVWLVKLVLSYVPKLVDNAGDAGAWQGCWACINDSKDCKYVG